MTNSVDHKEAAHNEPPLQDLSCLKIQLFSSLVLKVLNTIQSAGCLAVLVLCQTVSLDLVNYRQTTKSGR